MKTFAVIDGEIKNIEVNVEETSSLVKLLDGYPRETDIPSGQKSRRKLIVIQNEFPIEQNSFAVIPTTYGKINVQGNFIVVGKDTILGYTELTDEEESLLKRVIRTFRVGS